MDSKVEYISGTATLKSFLYCRKWNFSAQAQKIKNIRPEKIYSNIKKTFYIFSKESFSYILGKGNPEKILYISRNRTFLIFQGRNIQNPIIEELSYSSRKEYSEPWHNGTFLYFRKWCFLVLFLFLYFRK